MKEQPEGYPSSFDQFRKDDVYGHGGVRIYRVTPQLAAEIHKELKLPYEIQKFREGDQYYYLNQNHGEHHIIFVIPETASSTRSITVHD